MYVHPMAGVRGKGRLEGSVKAHQHVLWLAELSWCGGTNVNQAATTCEKILRPYVRMYVHVCMYTVRMDPSLPNETVCPSRRGLRGGGG